MVSCAVRAAGSGFGAGEGTLTALTVTVVLWPGMSSPGGWLVVTVYCAAPGPVRPPMAQVMLTVPAFETTKVCDPGASPPHVAPKVSNVGVTTGPPPIEVPDRGRPVGSTAHRAVVESTVIASEPTVAMAWTG